jgi:hypothetical protein
MPQPSADPAPSSEELRVPVAPVGSGGRGRGRGPLIGLATLVVVLVAGYALAQASPARPVGPSIVVPTVAASATPGASPTAVITLPARLEASELVTKVLDGSLDDYLVYADATLRADPALAIEGLGLEVVPNPIAPAETAVPAGAVLVLRVRGQRLEYLGSLLTARGGSPSLATLTGQLGAASPDAIAPTFRDAGGWLIPHPPCFVAASPEPRCDTKPFLAEDQPLPDGTRRTDAGATVALAPDIWGVDPLHDAVSPGAFLVRRLAADPTTWEIVARYEPKKSVRVVIP